jgi:hypothetical protein
MKHSVLLRLLRMQLRKTGLNEKKPRFAAA